jgi:hypothetical protein
MQTHLVDFLAQKSYPQNICRTWFRGPLTPENILSTEWILQLDYRLFRFGSNKNQR